jgi:hypothetical protein
MQITKRDLLRIIAEETQALQGKKALNEGLLQDIMGALQSDVEELIDMFVKDRGREPTPQEVTELITFNEDGKPLPGTGALKDRKHFGDPAGGRSSLNLADEPTGRTVKESIRKLIRKHTKDSKRIAIEESIRTSLRKVLSRD